MALETLDNQIDIKDLSLESPDNRGELPFDPARDITEEQRHVIAKRLDMYWNVVSVAGFVKLAAKVQYLFDNPDVSQRRNKGTLEQALGRLKSLDQTTSVLEFLELAAYAQLYFKDIDIPIRREFGEIIDSTTSHLLKNSWEDYLERMVYIKIAFPERFPDLKLPGELLESLHGNLYASLELAGQFEEQDLRYFTGQMVQLRILSPEKFKDLVIPETFWQRVGAEASYWVDHPKDNEDRLVEYLFDASVIGATEVTLDKNGMRLSFASDLQQAGPENLPQQRKF